MNADDTTFAIMALSAVFFVVDPIVVVPLFLAITRTDTPEKKRSIALRAALAALITLTLFALAGGFIFRAFGITLGAFKIAGGLMLFMMSVEMIRARPSRTQFVFGGLRDLLPTLKR